MLLPQYFGLNVQKARKSRRKYSFPVREQAAHARKVKQTPSDKDGQHAADMPDDTRDFALIRQNESALKQEQDEIIKAPQNKVQACPVPKAGQKPHDEGVA